MFMLLGYSPELSQAVFRIGGSVTKKAGKIPAYKIFFTNQKKLFP
jgi:p-aminobenzoyl-glutamate transporter AbgT